MHEKAEESGRVGPAIAAGRLAWLLPPLFVAVHALAIVLSGERAWLASLIFLTLAPLLAGAACVWRARRSGYAEGWYALALAMLLWSGGMAGNLVAGVMLDSWSGVAGLSMLLFILYGVPVIFVAASSRADHWQVRLIDGLLAAALAFFFLQHTFAFATMADADPAGVIGLRLMFDIENLFIALFAVIRFRTATEVAKSVFFRSLTIYACVYLVTASFINHLHSDSYYGNPPDLVISVPFMLLAALALGEPQRSGPLHAPSSALVRAVNAASPLMLPATLLVVSAALVRGHPVLAIAGCAIAILAYGLRSILIQMRSLDDRDILERLSRVDELTGLANRRQFDEHLRHEWARARRSGEGLALLMIDIDHFKLLNDSLGHPVGDQRLRATAQALAACATRGSDIVARYGGEEFAAILPGATEAQAIDLAEMMRAAVDRLALASPAPGGHVTVSVGVGHCPRIGEAEVAGLVAAADAALYEAKQTGRNRWTVRSL